MRSSALLPGELVAVRPGGAPARVLVVDDLRDNREMYVEYLEFHGYVVLSATDGRQAVEIARTQRPDLIVMDMSLPELNGWEATRILRESPETRDIIIIALSGHADAPARKRAMRSGCDMFVAKPCLPQDLLAHVRAQLLDRSRPPARRAKKR